MRELESAVTALQEQLAAAQGEGRSLREKWNLTDFKYQLLVDMWTMRVLDNDVTAAGAEEERRLEELRRQERVEHGGREHGRHRLDQTRRRFGINEGSLCKTALLIVYFQLPRSARSC